MILLYWKYSPFLFFFVRKIEKTREKQERVFFSQNADVFFLSDNWSTANGHVTPSIPTNFTIGCFPTQHPILPVLSTTLLLYFLSLSLSFEFLFFRGDQRGKPIVRFCQPHAHFSQRIYTHIIRKTYSIYEMGNREPVLEFCPFFLYYKYIYIYIFQIFTPPFRTGLREIQISVLKLEIVIRLLRDRIFCHIICFYGKCK